MLGLFSFAVANAKAEFPTSKSSRYCPMCDEWFSAKHVDCPKCGMPTERQPKGEK